ncbi:LGFP repeat-containing protein [Salinifilum aidingensis]
MNRRKRYLRGVVSVASASALAVGVPAAAAGASGEPRPAGASAPICDYQPGATARVAGSAIDDRYESEVGLRQMLGEPVAEEVVDGGMHYREYENGRLYWTEATGVRESHGDVLAKYLARGGHEAFGAPITDECATADGRGRYNHFTGTSATGTTSVYWRPDLGAHLIHGPVREHWENAAWETGTYGYPATDTMSTPDGSGLFGHFTGGDGLGASIYWTPGSGVHGVQGQIRQHWADLDWERSYLGYPTSDEFDTPTGKRSNFQGGYITWNARTGETQDFSW